MKRNIYVKFVNRRSIALMLLALAIVIVSMSVAFVYRRIQAQQPRWHVETGEIIEDLEFGETPHLYVAKSSSPVIERRNVEDG
ncbi:MAG: hypothetical protein DIU80_010125 [Chloroflexota bacterium]